MTNIIIQPEVIKALADCVVDIIQNKIDWQTIDWQSVAEKAAERPKGEWLNHGYDNEEDGLPEYVCPICGKNVFENVYNYCPNCGAEMKN